MIGCLRTRVRKQPIIALYFEFEIVLKFYNLDAMLRVCSLTMLVEIWEKKMLSERIGSVDSVLECWD